MPELGGEEPERQGGTAWNGQPHPGEREAGPGPLMLWGCSLPLCLDPAGETRSERGGLGLWQRVVPKPVPTMA